MINAVLFDFDNTLYDYERCNRAGMDAVVRHLCFILNEPANELSERFKEVCGRIKKSNNPSIKFNKIIYLQELTKNRGVSLYEIKKCHDIFQKAFFQELRLYDGVKELLVWLKTNKIPVGIISNNQFHQQIDKLEHLKILEYIECMTTSSECGEEKPHPKMFTDILQKLGKEKGIVMVGDSMEHDIFPGLDCGMLCFHFDPSANGIAWKGAHLKFGRFADLLAYLRLIMESTREFVFLSRVFGQSVMNIQGAGGNISIRLDGESMLIKSSGRIMGNTTTNDGFCIGSTQEPFYKLYGNGKPSMEAGFHTLLRKYTIHLHFIPIFLDRLSLDDPMILEIPYTEPGLPLYEAIKDRARPETRILILENHGIILTGDTTAEVFDLYDRMCERYEVAEPERMAHRISRKIHETTSDAVVVRPTEYHTRFFEPIHYCFPDLAVFADNVLRLPADLSEIRQAPVLIVSDTVFLCAGTRSGLEALSEIMDAYHTIMVESAVMPRCIDGIETLQTREEERYRKKCQE